MRTFYIFSINNNFYSLYRNNNKELFDILKDISKLTINDVNYATSVFYQVNKNINKNLIDKRIFIDYHREIFYTKKKEVHIYNNLYTDELSFMEIKNNYIKIKTNKNFSSFFKILENYDKNFFVCDFKKNDYFFLSSVKTLV